MAWGQSQKNNEFDSLNLSTLNMEEGWFLASCHIWNDSLRVDFIHSQKGRKPSGIVCTSKEHCFQPVSLLLQQYDNARNDFQEREADSGEVLQALWADLVTEQVAF